MLPRLWATRKSFAAMLAAIALVRVAGFLFGLINVDECDFSLFGRLWLGGSVPYVGVVDNKPPLTYGVFALANLLGGAAHWILAIRIIGIATVFATSLALFAAARAWTGDERHGWAAAWLGIAAGLCESPSVSAELLMNLPVAVALWLLARAAREERPWLDAAAGVAAAVATLFKQQAAVLILATAIAFPWEAVRTRVVPASRPAARIAAFAAGCAAPWLATLALFARLGALRDLEEWLLLRNFAQVGTASPFSASRALAAFATCVVGAALLSWVLAVRGLRNVQGLYHRLLVVLLCLTLIPVAMGGRFYEHYFLQFVPPLALLGARPLVDLRVRWAHVRPAARAAVLALAIVPVLGYVTYTLGRGWAGAYPLQDEKTSAVAAWLAGHTSPAERVFVWGDVSAIYCGANRMPGTRYLRASFHVGDLDPAHADPRGVAWRASESDVGNTLADLEERRPELFVDTATGDLHHWSLFPLHGVPRLEAYVREHYRLEATPGGIAVYRRM
jgi:4-amino-4-deoxy-L-arabinose transferase-like glycosyltransferase